MKAIICTKYGPPEVLQLKEVEKPRAKKSLKKTGIYLNVLTSSGTIKLKAVDLVSLKGLIEAGKLKSVIDRCYPLVEAHRYVDKGYKKVSVEKTTGFEVFLAITALLSVNIIRRNRG